jgi:hypothetical protein
MRRIGWMVSAAFLGTSLTACGSGHGGGPVVPGLGNASPAVAFVDPVSDVEVSRGAALVVRYVDDDPDDAARTSLYLDADGDFATHGDQVLLEEDRPELDGAEQAWSLEWDLASFYPGSYRVIAVCEDGVNPPSVAVSPGHVQLLGDVAWAAQVGGGGNDALHSVAACADGGTLAVGLFTGTAFFSPSFPSDLALVSAGGGDAFVARYGADGVLLWAKRAGGAGSDEFSAVAALPDGSFLVAGIASDGAVFGAGEANETTLDGTALFVARYERDGTFAWVRTAAAGGGTTPTDLALFPDGSFVLVGEFDGSLTFGPGAGAETTITASGAGAAFVARYAADGSPRWARAGVGTFARAAGVATLLDGSCVVSGEFVGDVRFGDGVSSGVATPSSGSLDAVLVRYDADGAATWVRTMGGTGVDRALDVAATPAGSILVTGEFQGTASFGAGSSQTTLFSVGSLDPFLASYDGSGDLMWARSIEGSQTEFGARIGAFADGSFVLGGGAMPGAQMTFGRAAPGEIVLTATGPAFLARFDAQGRPEWARTFGASSVTALIGLAAAADGSVAVGGTFTFGPVRFGAGDPHETTLPHSTQDSEGFVARFNADGGF